MLPFESSVELLVITLGMGLKMDERPLRIRSRRAQQIVGASEGVLVELVSEGLDLLSGNNNNT